MLKYIKEHMATNEGIEIFPIIALVIFLVFFLVLLVYVARTDRSTIEEISQYPLDNHKTEEG